MRKIALIAGVVVAVIAVAGIALWPLKDRHVARDVGSPASVPLAIVTPAQRPPEPNVSLDINSETESEADSEAESELRQGIPLLLTVRLSNQRAANAQSANAANDAAAAAAREQLKAGTITPAESQARIAFSSVHSAVPTVALAADWPKSVHFQVRRAGDPAIQPDWPVSLIAAPETQAVVLDAKATTEAIWGVPPEAAARLAPGSWQVVAVLDTGAGAPANAWRGRAMSDPVTVTITPRPSSPSAAEVEQDALEVARYYAAAAQWDRSLEWARKAAAVNSDSIGAHTLIGDALAARGDHQGAIEAFQSAMAAFRKKTGDPNRTPEYLVMRIRRLQSVSPPPGL